MGGRDRAQTGSPLEAKLVGVEAGKTRDRGLEPLAFRRRWAVGTEASPAPLAC
jgi:hypothetical protein